MLTQEDLRITSLGPRKLLSPLRHLREGPRSFVPDDRRVMYHIEYCGDEIVNPLGFEKAGPREQLYFDPAECRAAIVTCGGLCPGLNNIIRNLYYKLHGDYGVPTILGIRNGYLGLNPELGREPFPLTDSVVEQIHHQGGTILGTSRGPQDARVMVDYLESLGVNLFFPIGGDGTQKGAHLIAQEIERRGLKIAVVGVPKTIDNDIKFCYRSFGYLSAVSEAETVIDRAHVEAKSTPRGVGLVKLMGREAGFIAAAATIASGEVNFTLIPEAPFSLDELLPAIGRRLDKRDHAVIVVAEGAGQDLIDHEQGRDKSGNRKLGDIGPFLKQAITDHFNEVGKPAAVKYFDPSYYIRSVQANAADSLLCEMFARCAAHAALAGKTDLFIGLWNNRPVHVPLRVSVGQVKRMEPARDLWSAVLATTGQEKW
ncbi:6-phosphofructokinase [Posidoniimonas polymericola]|uniref:6-phosphofructokinase n=1 Tax=Posidoniimonas polymericola TaxID=2528002 RepID=A0A5C5YDJ2_9BACT|nr:ATP-dependent 6-phosphofructokinase [Posidoniimonas polymericola]TWT73807.1 6-phosphofructokinase [Posidoniimonas polymericola]